MIDLFKKLDFEKMIENVESILSKKMPKINEMIVAKEISVFPNKKRMFKEERKNSINIIIPIELMSIVNLNVILNDYEEFYILCNEYVYILSDAFLEEFTEEYSSSSDRCAILTIKCNEIETMKESEYERIV